MSAFKKKVAILSENGFEEVELTSPKKAMEDAGMIVEIVSPQKQKIKGWDHDHWSIELPVDVMIPGGVMNPDLMRVNEDCVNFAKEFLESGKPVAAICHAPQLLIETGMLKGRIMTSYPSIKTDLINAGVKWQDKEVIADRGLITSRSPKDLDAFNEKLLEEIREGVHEHA